jgi:hypothetical protein
MMNDEHDHCSARDDHNNAPGSFHIIGKHALNLGMASMEIKQKYFIRLHILIVIWNIIKKINVDGEKIK